MASTASGVRGDEVVDRVRVALAPEPAGVGPEGDAAGVGVDRDAPGVVALALAEDEAAEDEEPAGRRPRR